MVFTLNSSCWYLRKVIFNLGLNSAMCQGIYYHLSPCLRKSRNESSRKVTPPSYFRRNQMQAK